MDTYVVETKADLMECLALRKKVFVEEQGVPEAIEVDEYDASPKSAIHVLVKADGIPAGTGRWILYQAHTAKIQRLAVLAQFRGQGVGRLVVIALEKQARLAGCQLCILDSQLHAEPFYKKLGYVTVSDKPFLDAGILHVRMEKRLSHFM